MFLLEYAIDEQNDKEIIAKVSVEELVCYVNPFIQEWVPDFAEWKGVKGLWSMQR